MNRDEQRRITGLIERAVRDCPLSPLAPMDVEADAIIRALFVRNPEAAYRVTMLAMAQAAALEVPRVVAVGVPAPGGLLAKLFAKRRPPDEVEVSMLQRAVSG